MPEIAYEDVFTTIVNYLRHGGIPLTRDKALTTVRLMEEFLSSDSAKVVEEMVLELPRRLDIPASSLPLSCPPINRGSIGYGNEW